MRKYHAVLGKCRLFDRIDESGMEGLLDCLHSRRRSFGRNSFILSSGERPESVGVVLSGAVHVIREDFWGRRRIVERIEGGGLFGESFVCAGMDRLPVSVLAATDAEILFINIAGIVSPCSPSCAFHSRLVGNLAVILAEKNAMLVRKLEHVTQATTREKLMSYLCEESRIAGSGVFSIPFNREELADYLSVERSAMSAELSRMRDDGLVTYRKNRFELLRGGGEGDHEA